jgi:hypothetical protein
VAVAVTLAVLVLVDSEPMLLVKLLVAVLSLRQLLLVLSQQITL